MFQNNSISVDNPDYLLMDLIHQLEVNPELKASEIVEQLQEGRCFDGKVYLKHKLPPQRAHLVMEGHKLRNEADKLKKKVSRFIQMVAKMESGEEL